METEGETVMATLTIQEAQAKLTDFIHRLTPGDEVVITENDQPVAKLVSEKPEQASALSRACARG